MRSPVYLTPHFAYLFICISLQMPIRGEGLKVLQPFSF